MSQPCDRPTDFVPHQLEGEALASFEQHLATCQRCAAAYADETLLDAVVMEAEAGRQRGQGEGGSDPADSEQPLDAEWLALIGRPKVELVLLTNPEPASVADGARAASVDPERARAAARRGEGDRGQAPSRLGALSRRLAWLSLPMAAGVLLGYGLHPGSSPTAPVAANVTGASVTPPTTRPFEGRVMLASADLPLEFQPADVMRGGALASAAASATPSTLRSDEVMRGAPTMPAPLLPLAQLQQWQQEQRWEEPAAAWMLAGNVAEAERVLTAALAAHPDSAAVRSDFAAVAIMRGRPEEALVLADSALAAGGGSQARWNRALALRDLGLPMLAARTFREVAAVGEKGWSQEALRQAEQLERPLVARRQDYRDITAAAQRMSRQEGPPLDADQVRLQPGLARLYFYDALRTASSRARVEALKELAERLDREWGGDTLQRRLRVVAGSDFKVRAPLAKRYQELVPDSRRPTFGPEFTAFLEQLRRGRQEDLLLGALMSDDRGRDRAAQAEVVAEYRRLADASGDSWFGYIATVKEAQVDLAESRVVAARERLLKALDACHAERLEIRCNKIEVELADLFLKYGSPVEARRMAQLGLAHAREAREWPSEQHLLMLLGSIERTRQAFALSSANLEEARERVLDEKSVRELMTGQAEVAPFVVLEEALAALESLRIETASSGLKSYLATTTAPRQDAVVALAELQHWSPSVEGQRQAVAAIATMRKSAKATPGVRLLADATEGRVRLEAGDAAGRLLVSSALAQANTYLTGPEARGDVDAARARWQAITALVADAGRDHRWSEALSGLAAGLDAPAPGPCSLGVMLDYDRLLVAVRDPAGHDDGSYEPHRASPLRVEELVSPKLRGALAGCEVIDVYAAPPLQGASRLLPPELAWRHRVHATTTPVAAPLPPRRLVVAGARPPAWLELPPLLPGPDASSGATDPSGSTNLTLLDGWMATPSRVETEMRSATEIEFAVHGLVDPALSDAALLALTPETSGPGARYALTAGEIRKQRLLGHPLVVLASCSAGALVPSRHQSWGLPMAFVEAGARAVLATPSALSDRDAARFFEQVRAGVKAGRPIAAALRDARTVARNGHWHESLQDVVLFE